LKDCTAKGNLGQFCTVGETTMNMRRLIRVGTGQLLAAVLFFAPASLAVAASPNVAVLAFGLFGAQSVFESEAKGAASILRHMGTSIGIGNSYSRSQLSVVARSTTPPISLHG
jgi:hypothetical protein